MELLLTLLLVGVAYVVSAIRHMTPSETGGNKLPRGVMGEAFPAIEPVEEEEPFVVEQPRPRKRKNSAPAPRPVQKASVAPSAAVEPSPAPKEAPAAQKERFAIKTKSDAKRAIIYSEIFNRKYN